MKINKIGILATAASVLLGSLIVMAQTDLLVYKDGKIIFSGNSADVNAQRSSGKFHGKRLIHMFFSFSGSLPSETTEKKTFRENLLFSGLGGSCCLICFLNAKWGRKTRPRFCF